MPQQSPSSNSGMTPGSGGPQPMSQFGGVPGSNTMPAMGGGQSAPPMPYQQPQQGAFNPFASYFAASNPFMVAIQHLMQSQTPAYTQQGIAAAMAQRQAASGAPATYQIPESVQQILAQQSSPVTAQAPAATAAPSVASPIIPWYEGMNSEVGGASGGGGASSSGLG